MRAITVASQLRSIRHELLELERGDTPQPVVIRSIRSRLRLLARLTGSQQRKANR